MAILKKTIQPPGGLFAYSADLAFIQPILIAVEDLQFDVGTTEGNRMCRYAASEGKFYFNNSFDGTQRVFLIYKT